MSRVAVRSAFEWHVPADRQHWSRLKNSLPGLKSIGVDHLWIPPGCKGMDPSGNGYDIYDLYDLGEFDQKGSIATKWGTKTDLEEMANQASALGIGIIWDAVLNHKAGAEYPEQFDAVAVHPQQRDKMVSKPLQVHGWTGFDFPGRGNVYSAMKYHWPHFSGVDWDDESKTQQIFRILGPNKDWAPDVSTENGNYDYLTFADLDHSHPDVHSDLLQWGSWITELLPLSGMRLDAAKHFSVQFQRDFIRHVRKQVNPDLLVMGEYWTGDVSAIQHYLKELDYEAMAYDVPLLEKLSRISHIPHADLRSIFDDTLVKLQPDHAVTFVTNHDTQTGQMMDTPVAPSFKLLAYALILLRKEGLPSLFYGDLYGVQANTKHPMTPECDGKLPILTRARKNFAYGEQDDYFDQPNCIGFVRYGNANHRGLACVLSNAGPNWKQMFVGKQYSGSKWIDLLEGHSAPVTIDKKGCGNFPVKAMGVSVWVDAAGLKPEGLREDFNLNIYSY
ncbi:CAZyme family GH13 [Penicillium capsulatum]|uniref:CAZyme family GH13 n=1 Tax=Penicillium capsulatum TaxID=69766 RepID=A0A9W9ILG0_9EURO|nr:CAZyme family GH13 [Penicillium capsulatum]KAJ6122227.1 CAZyme family GH13 [Penicillium capsulatum]